MIKCILNEKLILLATKINTKRDSVISSQMSENKMAVINCEDSVGSQLIPIRSSTI